MRAKQMSLVWGLLLVVLGALFLAANLGLVGFLWDSLWALLFGAGGLAFLYVFGTDVRGRWWAVIPGFALLAIGGLIGMNAIFPWLGARLGGPFFLGMLGTSFAVVYLVERNHWWAVIPAGVLLTLATVAGVDQLPIRWLDSGALFFLGLGFTFALVAILPTPQGRMRWAFIPAGVMLVLGMIVAAQSMALLRFAVPLMLILGGAYLVLRGAIAKPREE
jgi:hypothetical protein